MLSFNKRELTPVRLDKWRDLGVNVLMIGEKGTGKTQNAIECFQRAKAKFAYFSAPTLDPWIHVIGIPKVKTVDGVDWLDFILPRKMDNSLEFIMLDEFNRCPPLIRNAIMELVQFKTINGREFPKLKAIWAAINPVESAGGSVYDVHELDPAQLDRFHVIIETPNKPCIKYFSKKFGSENGKILVEWWNSQPTQAHEILSPRRLDYIGEYFLKGGDIGDIVPICCNHADLIKKLSMDEDGKLFEDLEKNPSIEKFKTFASQKNRLIKFWPKLKVNKFWNYYDENLYPELLDSLIKESSNFRTFCVKVKNSDFLKGRLKECGFEPEKITKIVNPITKNPFTNDIKNLPSVYGYQKTFEKCYPFLKTKTDIISQKFNTYLYTKGIDGIIYSLKSCSGLFVVNQLTNYITFLTLAYKSLQAPTIGRSRLELSFWFLASRLKEHLTRDHTSPIRSEIDDLANTLEFAIRPKFNSHIQLIDYLREL